MIFIYWNFTNQNSRQLEMADDINNTLIIN